MDKPALRKKYKELRAQITKASQEDWSIAIANQCLGMPIWEATYFHIFLPIPGKVEVNTEFLLHILSGRDKSVVVPKVIANSGDMQHFLLQENTALAPSRYGVPEPVDGIQIPPQQMEVVFVPLLAYDKNGNRVGYGKGYYDRFLSQCKPNCLFIGLSFFPPEEFILTEIIDIPLHYCVTPQNVFRF